jgi:DNA mismatch endonuclease (patch repair protein)
MADKLTPEERSWLMSRVRGKDTKPEWILRSALHRMGFRYGLHNGKLPGKPDLVLRKYNTVIFVHGCFWHRHPGCPKSTTPKSNRAFWEEKFRRNVDRDARNRRLLKEAGWKVVVVWQCELYKRTVETIERVVGELLHDSDAPEAGSVYSPTPERLGLLRAAEGKVRYRLDRDDHDR